MVNWIIMWLFRWSDNIFNIKTKSTLTLPDQKNPWPKKDPNPLETGLTRSSFYFMSWWYIKSLSQKHDTFSKNRNMEGGVRDRQQAYLQYLDLIIPANCHYFSEMWNKLCHRQKGHYNIGGPYSLFLHNYSYL